MPVAAAQLVPSPAPGESDIDAICAPFLDPTAWVMREVLHACWGRRPEA